MRRYPQPGLSRAISSTSARTAAALPGRPGERRGWVQCRRARSACQRSRVRGELIRRSWRSWLPGSCRASAASTARSAHDSLGFLTCRWRTATWCRRIRSSASLARSDRASKASQPNTRSTTRYANRSDINTDSALLGDPRAARCRLDLLLPQEECGQVSGRDRIIGTHRVSVKFVLHDRDASFTASFDAVFLSLIHISEPTRLGMISYAVFCLKKKKQ